MQENKDKIFDFKIFYFFFFLKFFFEIFFWKWIIVTGVRYSHPMPSLGCGGLGNYPLIFKEQLKINDYGNNGYWQSDDSQWADEKWRC